MKNKILFLMLIFHISSVSSYVFQRADNGSKVKWPSTKGALLFFVDPVSDINDDPEETLEYVNKAVSEWGRTNFFDISVRENSGIESFRNDIFFSR